MQTLAEKLFYMLSATLLGAAFFVVQPAHNTEVKVFQTSVLGQFKVAAIQLWGEEPVLDNVKIVISGVNEFYSRSADAAIALLAPAESENDMYAIAGGVYKEFASIIRTPKSMQTQVAAVSETTEDLVLPPNFMQEEAVANIIPGKMAAASPAEKKAAVSKSVAAAKLVLDAPAVNDNGNSWVNLRDNSTGQVYCVAIYNAEVNRYLGPCKNDIH